MFKRIAIIAAVLLTILLISAGIIYISVSNMFLPVNAEAVDETVTVDIPAGANAQSISSILKDEGMIHNSLLFRLYARYSGLDAGFKAGSYHLSPAMSMREIMEKINSGDVYRDTVWFTIVEGFTVEQMAEKLAQQGLVDQARFLAIAKNPPQAIMDNFPFLEGIPQGEVKILLEGYLFPDTYEISPGVGEEEIIAILLRRMDTVFNQELRQRGAELGMSMHQVLTLASIVEKEAGVPYERERIAGVFHNRLVKNWALGSCATVNYVLGITKEVLSTEDTKVVSTYNTYQNIGLPPGPIAAPGEAAIRAALYPEETDYFYFNSKGDGSGESYFARTGPEHDRNTALMMQNINNRN